MASYDIPTWSASASESINILYRDLQPIEIYVEDSDSEAFYLELINRMLDSGQKIKKIIPLHGRDHVIRFCSSYQDQNPALFLIDGDIELLFGQRQKGLKNLFQLTAYCIENYLFCEHAARELIVESSGKALREHVLSSAEWTELLHPINNDIKSLFVTFACARIVDPSIKTVSYGLSSIITQHGRGNQPALDIEKIKQLNLRITTECIARIGNEKWERIKTEVAEHAKKVSAIDAISGKDFLLPILNNLVRSKGAGNMTTSSLMFRLAKHCALERLSELKHAINEVMAGRNFISR